MLQQTEDNIFCLTCCGYITPQESTHERGSRGTANVVLYSEARTEEHRLSELETLMLTLILPGSSGDIIVYYIIDSLIFLVAPFGNGENRVGVKKNTTPNQKHQSTGG